MRQKLGLICFFGGIIGSAALAFEAGAVVATVETIAGGVLGALVYGIRTERHVANEVFQSGFYLAIIAVGALSGGGAVLAALGTGGSGMGAVLTTLGIGGIAGGSAYGAMVTAFAYGFNVDALVLRIGDVALGAVTGAVAGALTFVGGIEVGVAAGMVTQGFINCLLTGYNNIYGYTTGGIVGAEGIIFLYGHVQLNQQIHARLEKLRIEQEKAEADRKAKEEVDKLDKLRQEQELIAQKAREAREAFTESEILNQKNLPLSNYFCAFYNKTKQATQQVFKNTNDKTIEDASLIKTALNVTEYRKQKILSVHNDLLEAGKYILRYLFGWEIDNSEIELATQDIKKIIHNLGNASNSPYYGKSLYEIIEENSNYNYGVINIDTISQNSRESLTKYFNSFSYRFSVSSNSVQNFCGTLPGNTSYNYPIIPVITTLGALMIGGIVVCINNLRSNHNQLQSQLDAVTKLANELKKNGLLSKEDEAELNNVKSHATNSANVDDREIEDAFAGVISLLTRFNTIQRDHRRDMQDVKEEQSGHAVQLGYLEHDSKVYGEVIGDLQDGMEQVQFVVNQQYEDEKDELQILGQSYNYSELMLDR